jgi:ferredoxin
LWRTKGVHPRIMTTRRQLLFGRPADAARQEPAPLVAAFGDACLATRGVVCRNCGEACGAGAIFFKAGIGGVARPFLHAGRCNGCGDCLPLCPSSALRLVAAPAADILSELPV